MIIDGIVMTTKTSLWCPVKSRSEPRTPTRSCFSILMLVYGLILAQNAVEKSLRIFRRPGRPRIPVIFLGNG